MSLTPRAAGKCFIPDKFQIGGRPTERGELSAYLRFTGVMALLCAFRRRGPFVFIMAEIGLKAANCPLPDA